MATGDIMPGRTGTRQPRGPRVCVRPGVAWVLGAGVGAGGGCPGWLWVSQCTQHHWVTPRPGLGKGVQGPCVEQEPPSTLTQPCRRPACMPTRTQGCAAGHQPPRRGRGREGSRRGFQCSATCRWDSGTEDSHPCPPRSPPPHGAASPPIYECKGAERSCGTQQHPSLLGGLRPRCIPGDSQSIP